MTAKVDVTVVLAANNTRESIDRQSRGIVDSLEGAGYTYEIIKISGNGNSYKPTSIDDTMDKNVHLKRDFKESEALKAGLKGASGEIVAYIVGRVNVDTKNLAGLVDKVRGGSDMVVGYRLPRRDSLLNRLVSKLFNLISRFVTGLNLHDLNSGVIVARREVYRRMPMYGDLDKFIPILAHRHGFKVTEEKIEQMPGAYRQSFYLNDYINRFLDIITVIFLVKYSKKPLHLMGFFGLIFAGIGMVINIYLFIYRITGMGGIAGRPLLVLGVLLLLIGIQMISIGLLGEMIIFTHARDLEDYEIEEIVE
jgi:glycosyltransferase involved in cell wall biosynthesis